MILKPLQPSIAPLSQRDVPVDAASRRSTEIVDRYRETHPVYLGGSRVLRWSTTSASGMAATFELADADTKVQHPFKGLRAAKASNTEGQRLMLILLYPDTHPLYQGKSVYVGEAILVWWSEDCAEGMKVTLKFNDGPDGVTNGLHPCDGMATGRRTGEILNMTAWVIDDAEVPQRAPRSKRSFDSLAPTIQSHILCRDEGFQKWARQHIRSWDVPDVVKAELSGIRDGERFAEAFVKMWCGVSSRADLKSSGSPGAIKWRKLYAAYDASRPRYSRR